MLAGATGQLKAKRLLDLSLQGRLAAEPDKGMGPWPKHTSDKAGRSPGILQQRSARAEALALLCRGPGNLFRNGHRAARSHFVHIAGGAAALLKQQDLTGKCSRRGAWRQTQRQA